MLRTNIEFASYHNDSILRNEATSEHEDNNVFQNGIDTTLLLLILCGVCAMKMFSGGKLKTHLLNGNQLNIPPGSRGLPLIGETIQFLIDGRAFARSRRYKYGHIFRTHLCGYDTVVVHGSENVRKILKADGDAIEHVVPSGFIYLFGSNGLCGQDKDNHRRLQHIILRALQPRTLSQFVCPIRSIVQTNINDLLSDGNIVQCADVCRHLSLTIAQRILLGVPHTNDEMLSLFKQFNSALFSPPINIPGSTFYRGMQARKRLLDIIMSNEHSEDYSVLNEIRTFVQETTSTDKPLSNSYISQREFQDTCLEVFCGAIETTASAMCTALVHLARCRSVVIKMRDELDSLDIEGYSYDCLNKLPYLSAVVDEILRIQPPVAGGFRRAVKDFQVGDYVIPSGWNILYSITDTHELSSQFVDVDQFNPDRWYSPASYTQGSNNLKRHDKTFEYLPFGKGSKRFCVGKNLGKLVLKVFLVEMVKSCEWILVNGTPLTTTAPFPFPADKLPLKFVRRN